LVFTIFHIIISICAILSVIVSISWLINSNSNFEFSLQGRNSYARVSTDSIQQTSKASSKDYNFTLDPSPNPIIQSYTSNTSIYPGETLDFYVNSTENYKVKIYRLGWYTDNSTYKLVYDDPELHKSFRQPAPYYNVTTNFVDPRWQKSFSLDIPHGWNTGVYFAELMTQKKDVTYALFVVKNSKDTGDIIMKLPVATYQAYNQWGGKSLYETLSDNRTLQNSLNPHIKRAFKVTFDRPYAENNGMGQFLRFDFPLVRFLEKNGYNVSYITDVDLHEDENILNGFKVFISSGHDEYWSYQMRKNLEDARDKGLDIVFSSGNVMDWQIRFEDSFDGRKDRVIICYKNALLDPIASKNSSLVTVMWKDEPVNLPENSIVGTLSDEVHPVQGSFTVVNSSNWIYNGTGLRDGDKVPGIIGYEVQHYVINGFEPKNLTIVGHSLAKENQTQYTYADTVLFTTQSNSTVFSAGSIQWNWGLDNKCNHYACGDPRLQIMMKNILDKMIKENTKRLL
jgi:hypothetical protein